VGEKTEFPGDLLELERERVQARRDLDFYVRSVEVERRVAFPGAEQVVERCMWPDELMDRWYELRAEYADAAAAVKAHPLLVQAAAGGTLWKTEEELRRQVPRVDVEVRRNLLGGGERVAVLVDGIEHETVAQQAAA
jgi:hypothetical protein